jgi:hypothetical protein
MLSDHAGSFTFWRCTEKISEELALQGERERVGERESGYEYDGMRRGDIRAFYGSLLVGNALFVCIIYKEKAD